MKVHELIEFLKTCNPDYRVLVHVGHHKVSTINRILEDQIYERWSDTLGAMIDDEEHDGIAVVIDPLHLRND